MLRLFISSNNRQPCWTTNYNHNSKSWSWFCFKIDRGFLKRWTKVGFCILRYMVVTNEGGKWRRLWVFLREERGREIKRKKWKWKGTRGGQHYKSLFFINALQEPLGSSLRLHFRMIQYLRWCIRIKRNTHLWIFWKAKMY